MKQLIFILLATIIWLLFITGAMEAFLRTDGRYELYHEKNNQPYVSQYTGRTSPEHAFRYAKLDSFVFPKKEFTEVRAVNRLGFTDHRELDEMDTSRSVRILALGDSFTEGVGAAYAESWPQALERLLNQLPSGKKYIVYNAGVSGCDPFFSYKNLRLLAPAFHPHVVILLINTTDYTDVYFRGGWERFKAGNKVVYSRKAPWWEPLYAKSHAARAVVDLLGYNIFLTREPYEQVIMSTFPVIRHALDSFKIYSAANDIAFIPVFNPIPAYHSEEQYDQDSIFISHYIAPENPGFLDLTPVVRQHRYDKAYFWQYDNHCTALGYKLFAEKILEHLQAAEPDIF